MTDTQKIFWLIAIAAFGWLVYLLSPVLPPFLMAALLAYLFNPVVDKLQTKGVTRTLSVALVFFLLTILLILVLLLLVPQIENQLHYLIRKLPEYIDVIQNKFLPWLAAYLGVTDIEIDSNLLKQWFTDNWAQAGGFAKTVLSSLSKSGLAVVAWVGSVVLVPVVGFYLLRDWNQIIARIREMVPRNIEPVFTKLTHDSDEVLGAFIRGQLLVMLALGIIYSIGLSLIGLKLAILIGMLAGLVSFVPYLGFIIGILAATIAILLQTQQAIDVLYVLGVFTVGQFIESVVLTPALVGERIGLHPVAVIFAVLAGGQLFGFIGVLLALPVAAVLMVILRHVHEDYMNSAVYKNE
jgi:predicted PurR-regulated permease PerM